MCKAGAARLEQLGRLGALHLSPMVHIQLGVCQPHEGQQDDLHYGHDGSDEHQPQQQGHSPCSVPRGAGAGRCMGSRLGQLAQFPHLPTRGLTSCPLMCCTAMVLAATRRLGCNGSYRVGVGLGNACWGFTECFGGTPQRLHQLRATENWQGGVPRTGGLTAQRTARGIYRSGLTDAVSTSMPLSASCSHWCALQRAGRVRQGARRECVC